MLVGKISIQNCVGSVPQKGEKMKKLFKLVFALSLILVLGGCQGGEGQEDVLESDVFETMETVDLEGNNVSSEIFEENKLTVINAWNIGCTPCIEELPILNKLNEELANKGISIKGLYLAGSAEISNDERQEVENLLGEAKANYQQILPSKEMSQSDLLGSISAFPTTFFINSQGEIIDFIEGSSDYDGWKSLIEEKLSEVD